MLKARLNIEITRTESSVREDTSAEGPIDLLMAGICGALIDIENSLPEEARSEFRSDFLTTLNERRKEAN